MTKDQASKVRALLARVRRAKRAKLAQAADRQDAENMFTYLENNDPLTCKGAKERRAYLGLTELPA